MQYYLAGPMTGIEKYNFPLFDEVAADLRLRGMDIVSPHEIDHGETEETRGSLPYTEYIKAGLKQLLECGAIVLLPGWEVSNGCHLEVLVARQCGMTVYTYDPIDQTLRNVT